MPKSKDQKRKEAMERLDNSLRLQEKLLEVSRKYLLEHQHSRTAMSLFKLDLGRLNKTRISLGLPKVDEHNNEIN